MKPLIRMLGMATKGLLSTYWRLCWMQVGGECKQDAFHKILKDEGEDD